MMVEEIVPAHARGVAAVLAEAGLRSAVSVSRFSGGVSVVVLGPPTSREDAVVEALLEALTGSGYEAQRGQVMTWIVRVTGKRKSRRVPS